MNKAELMLRDEAAGRLKGVAENAMGEAMRMVEAAMPDLGGSENHELAMKLAEAVAAYYKAEVEMARAFSDVRMRLRNVARAMED